MPLPSVPLATVICVAFALIGASRARASELAKTASLQAEALLNLALFADWPGNVFASAEAPLRICVWERASLAAALERQATGRQIRQHPFEIQQVDSLEGVRDCHMLYVGRFPDRPLRQALATARQQPVLTVSDLPGFAQSGGIVEFVPEPDRVRMLVNPRALGHAGLILSSKLLAMAEVVAE